MRLTSILQQVNYHRHFKRIWKRQGKMEVQDLGIPAELQSMNVEIKDARNILLETKLFKPTPEIVRKGPILAPSALLKEKWFYVMYSKTKVSENENQTLCLTKTIAYQNLPESITSLVGKESLPNQDRLVQDSILQAQVWDADQFKLPKEVDVLNPGWKIPPQYGIYHKKKVSNMLEKLSYLCESAVGKYSGCFQRNIIPLAFSQLPIERYGESITFKMPSEFVITSTKPLRSFATAEEVAKTEQETVPNIYPVKPTLDLEKYKESPLIQDHISAHTIPEKDSLHTLFVAQKSFGFWFPKQLLARSIATCFAFTAREAKKKYGESVKQLPEPISVQCVYMDIKSFNFLAYQLNTLDLSDDNGVKNQVWIGEEENLYDEVSEKDLITNYNPAVFPKLLAIYMNGLE